MNPELTFRQGLVDTLPTVLGYIGIGLAFGIIAHAAGMSLLVIFLLSFVVYAGAAQFIGVSMMAAGSPIASVVASVFLVNSRMILMSSLVAPSFAGESLGRNVWIGTLLTDESFGLGMNKRNYTAGGRLSFQWFNAVNLFAYLVWGLATLAGGVAGGFIPDPERLGLSFALTAMFIGLLYLQIRADQSLPRSLQLVMVGLTLLLVYLGLVIIPANLLVLVVTLVACGLGLVVKRAF